MKYLIILILILCCLNVFDECIARADQGSKLSPKVERVACLKVFVSLKTSDKITYSYDVKNICGSRSLRWNQLRIGQYKWNGEYELQTLPPKGGVKSPTNWKPSSYSTEESDKNNSVQWSNNTNPEIKAGQEVSGFSVTLDAKDDSYKFAHWTVILENSADVSGSLEVK